MTEAESSLVSVYVLPQREINAAGFNGLLYCVHRAMEEGSGEENNAYSLIVVFADGTIRNTGFRKQNDYRWG